MGNCIKKTPDANGIFQYVQSVNSPDYPTVDWEANPDVSAVSAVSRNYWKYDGSNAVVEMSQVEKDAVDASLIALAQQNIEPVAMVYNNTQTFSSEEEKIITLPQLLTDFVVHVFDPSYQELLNEVVVSAAGSGPVGWDPGSISTNENNLNNGNFADLAYNNSITGLTSGRILGIDMLTPTMINAVRRYDYNTGYYDKEWEFIGTDDPTAAAYTVIFKETQAAAALNPNPTFRAFADQTFRYYGWRCVTSFNATYTITSELQLLTGTLTTVERELAVGEDYEVSKLSGTQVTVKNLKTEQRDLKTVVIGR